MTHTATKTAPQDIPTRSQDYWVAEDNDTPFDFRSAGDDSLESGPSTYLQTPTTSHVVLPASPDDSPFVNPAKHPHSPSHAFQIQFEDHVATSQELSPLSPQTSLSPVIDLLTTGVGELAHALDSRELTSVRAIKMYLAQIERLNGYLHALNYVAARETLLEQAKECDRCIRSEGFDRRYLPLCGIPVVVKDNIGTAAEFGMPTTAGSLALLGNTPRYDSHIVKKLRAAGAIIIGKANMTELASYRSRCCPNGWSLVGGQTVNAYAAHVCPGSSSSGNGVAAAAGFCPLSIGTETDGSLTLPAMQSALYALKPTVGLLSREGIVPFAPTFDTPGAMAKDVWSIAVGMDVMAGPDEEDVASLTVPRLPNTLRYLDFCLDPSFYGIRIGVPRANWFNYDPWCPSQPYHPCASVLEAFDTALATMSSGGATVIDHADIPSAADGSLWKSMHGGRQIVVQADFKEAMNRYLRGTASRAGCESIEEIIAFNKQNAVLEMSPERAGQELLEEALCAPAIDSVEYLRAKDEMQYVAGPTGLDAVLEGSGGLDAIFVVGHGKHSLAAMAGAPIGTVPLGLMEDGEPIGAYFIARRGGEGTLLRIMAAWEKAFGPRPLPPIAGAVGEAAPAVRPPLVLCA